MAISRGRLSMDVTPYEKKKRIDSISIISFILKNHVLSTNRRAPSPNLLARKFGVYFSQECVIQNLISLTLTVSQLY